MAEQPMVQSQPVFLQAQKLREAEGEGGIVAQSAEVAQMIGHALAFQHQRAQQQGPRRYLDPARRLDRVGVGPGVGAGRVAGNAAHQTRTLRHIGTDEQLFDALVLVTQALLQAQHALADDGKPEVARLDDAGMNGADRNFVRALAADLDEIVVTGRILESGVHRHGGHGVVAQGIPVRRPGAMAQPGPLITAVGGDADHVAGRALHAVGGGKPARQIGITGLVGRQFKAQPGVALIQSENAMQAKAAATLPFVAAPECRQPATGEMRGGGEIEPARRGLARDRARPARRLRPAA